MKPVTQDKRETTRPALRVEVGNIAVIRPANTKHGLRANWNALEFAQLAIQALQGSSPSKNQNFSQLTLRRE